ncbi:MAG TPA: heat-inducible transcriptional repressor HrcA, partial [Actinomycetota bacterium]
MAEQRADLGPRKAAVLRAVVEEYVRTGEPVGSETIAERAELGVSSATIRNEMAALEELGYLMHPHTSAGRIPTDHGYRHYVDSLPPAGRLRDAQRRAITGYFAEAILDLEEVLKGSVQLLSRLTQYAGLAVPPSASDELLVRLELIDMGPTLMILAIGQHGRVDKRILDRPEGMDSKAVAQAERRVQAVRGLSYADAQARLLQLAAGAPALEHDLLLMTADTLRTATEGDGSTHVVVGGVANLA